MGTGAGRGEIHSNETGMGCGDGVRVGVEIYISGSFSAVELNSIDTIMGMLVLSIAMFFGIVR
jgi:hypothetical protein